MTSFETRRNMYLDLLRVEISEGSKSTELRSLIGRLGEMECCVRVNGTLPEKTNQQGYDVIDSNGRRISVKTTSVSESQLNQPIRINPNTVHLCDDLMVLYFNGEELSVLYYGPMQKVIENINSKDGWIGLNKLQSLN